MKVLLSIKPHFAEEILSGKKKYEFRKRIFKSDRVEKVILYATKPVGKIVGEFLIDEVLHNDPKSLWDVTHSSAGISKEYFDDYFSGKSSGYAIKVKSPKRYKKNLDIREIHKSAIAPQSFAYVP